MEDIDRISQQLKKDPLMLSNQELNQLATDLRTKYRFQFSYPAYFPEEYQQKIIGNNKIYFYGKEPNEEELQIIGLVFKERRNRTGINNEKIIEQFRKLRDSLKKVEDNEPNINKQEIRAREYNKEQLQKCFSELPREQVQLCQALLKGEIKEDFGRCKKDDFDCVFDRGREL